MFPFSSDPKDQQPTDATPVPKAAEAHPLDALTGGVFSAATSGERAQRVRDWLASGPAQEQMHEVFKELSAKDKGAARALRTRLDELRRAKEQDAVSVQWEGRAHALLDGARLNIADALAWQRDAAKAGAPLSREPLAGLRARLVERIKAVEDLQQRVMVQREAAALLAQRIELLSTKTWTEARDQQSQLEADLAHWLEQTAQLRADAQWPSVDLRYPPQLEGAQGQLEAVWSAFVPALAQAIAAAQDATAPLPTVPVWSDELLAARGHALAAVTAPTPRPRVDPEQRAAASKAVEAGAMLLEQAVAAGNIRSMNSATQALRQSLKTHGRLIDDALEARVHAALVSAGELEGWQRWSADKSREQLVARAEALLVKRRIQGASGALREEQGEPVVSEPPPVPVTTDHPVAVERDDSIEGSATADIANAEPDAAPEAAAQDGDAAAAAGAAESAPPIESGFELIPAMGGRKLQEALRKLREEWKTADQGGPPNHALWKRFDRACNAAHRFVEAWIDGVRAEASEHRAQRLALIEEVKAFSASPAEPAGDWKAFNRQIHRFSERWRNAGHLAEKAYAELQAQWKAAIHTAAAPLEAEQKASTARRQALIAEAEQLGAAVPLRIDAVRALQQRWQAEAQSVPLERKHEQKLWDAFRKPLDEAFQRKGAERERQQAELGAHDRAVLEAAKALEAANSSGDAQRIRLAMAALEAATRSQAQASDSGAESKQAPVVAGPAPAATQAGVVAAMPEGVEATEPGEGAAPQAESVPAATAKPARAVVAVRGDDRPGAKRQDAASARGPGRGPDRRDGRVNAPRAAGERDFRGAPRPGASRAGGWGPSREERGPRLGDAAFRAQRDAVENAQAALRKLAAQAHGETLVQLLQAWHDRQPGQVPAGSELGRGVTPATRGAWVQAVGHAGGDAAQADTAMLRLEMAAELPTPADQLNARRALQLQLLTRRNDPAPAQTWGQDVATVLAADHDEVRARRLQNVLKALLRKG